MNPIDQKTQKELSARQKELKELTIDFQQLFDSERGKKVLDKISKMCKENEPTYIDQNPNGTAYFEGQRSIILGIRNILKKQFNQKEQEKAEL